MGEAFKKEQAKHHRNRRDRSAPKFCAEDLLSQRPEEARKAVRVEGAPGAALALTRGQSVLVSCSGSGVYVVIGNEVVGRIDSGKAVQLVAQVSDAGGLLPATVFSVSTVTGDFSVMLPACNGGGPS